MPHRGDQTVKRSIILAALLVGCHRAPCPCDTAPSFEAAIPEDYRDQCRALLLSSFPEAAHWEVLECGDLGVLATDGTDDFAVTGDGSLWHVDACGWTLIADDHP